MPRLRQLIGLLRCLCGHPRRPVRNPLDGLYPGCGEAGRRAAFATLVSASCEASTGRAAGE